MLHDAAHDSLDFVPGERPVVRELRRGDFERIERIGFYGLPVLKPFEEGFQPACVCPDRDVLDAHHLRVLAYRPFSRL